MANQTISLDHLTKIEGHATLTLQVDKGEIKRCELSSVEGSRYFEGIVKGRHYYEAPEMTSRICGICSCSHTLASILAMENAFDMSASKQTLFLRDLLAIGERLRSHATHLYFLALPDYLHHESVFTMLPKYEPEVRRALRIMRVGNELIKVVGGRDLHPVSAQIGGFLKYPSKEQMQWLEAELDSIRNDAEETARLFGSLPQPTLERRVENFSLFTGKNYPLLEGSLKSESHRFASDDFAQYIEEYQTHSSTANFVVLEGKSYLVGALARVNNNYKFLHPSAKAGAEEAGVSFPHFNPFMNNFAQALELVHYVEEAKALCKKLEKLKPEPVQKIEGEDEETHGIAAIEAPRGVLWHEYDVDENGLISHANIVTPTAQNLRNMQENIRALLPSLLEQPRQEIVLEVEKLIRSYDPCFSCSTHFLKVRWLKPSRKKQHKT